MRWTHSLLFTAAVLLGLSLAGCSTQAKRVDCDGTLKPINRPTPPAVLPMPPKEPPSSDGKPNNEK
jgi:hypothetical protein